MFILQLLGLDLFHFFSEIIFIPSFFFIQEIFLFCFIGRQGASIHIPTMLWQLDFSVMENGCTQVLKMAQLRFGI